MPPVVAAIIGGVTMGFFFAGFEAWYHKLAAVGLGLAVTCLVLAIPVEKDEGIFGEPVTAMRSFKALLDTAPEVLVVTFLVALVVGVITSAIRRRGKV